MDQLVEPLDYDAAMIWWHLGDHGGRPLAYRIADEYRSRAAR